MSDAKIFHASIVGARTGAEPLGSISGAPADAKVKRGPFAGRPCIDCDAKIRQKNGLYTRFAFPFCDPCERASRLEEFQLQPMKRRPSRIARLLSPDELQIFLQQTLQARYTLAQRDLNTIRRWLLDPVGTSLAPEPEVKRIWL